MAEPWTPFKRSAAFTLLACAGFTALPALAADADREAAGWHKWADFTGNVVAAGKAEPFDFASILTACDGVTGMVSGQGFQFPYWAQNTMMACRVFDTFKDVADKTRAGFDKASSADWMASSIKAILKREKRGLCRNASSTSKELGKAEAVEAEPRAMPLALELKTQMDRVMKLADC